MKRPWTGRQPRKAAGTRFINFSSQRTLLDLPPHVQNN